MIYRRQKKNSISDGLAQYRRQGGILLDVRDRKEYQTGHLSGAVNLPLSEIEKFAKRYPNRSVHIFVYCKSGKRSRTAAAFLNRQGYKKVTDLGGFWCG